VKIEFFYDNIDDFEKQKIFDKMIPCVLKAISGPKIELSFNGIFRNDFIINLDIKYLSQITEYPIIYVGSNTIAFAHMMVELKQKDQDLIIYNAQYFTIESGWSDMIIDGLFVQFPDQPDPDWL
jgi:hypothetical protein